MQKLLSSREVSDLIGVTQETVQDYVNTGRLIGSKIGQRFKFRPEDVEDFVRANRKKANHATTSLR